MSRSKLTTVESPLTLLREPLQASHDMTQPSFSVYRGRKCVGTLAAL